MIAVQQVYFCCCCCNYTTASASIQLLLQVYCCPCKYTATAVSILLHSAQLVLDFHWHFFILLHYCTVYCTAVLLSDLLHGLLYCSTVFFFTARFTVLLYCFLLYCTVYCTAVISSAEFLKCVVVRSCDRANFFWLCAKSRDLHAQLKMYALLKFFFVIFHTY